MDIFIENLPQWILILVTVIYVIFTYKIAKSNATLNTESYRPYVTISIENREGFLELRIKNIGNRVAKNLKVKFDPTIRVIEKFPYNTSEKKSTDSFLNQKYLHPGFNEAIPLMTGKEYVVDSTLQREFDLSISYESDDKIYKYDYEINIGQYIFDIKARENDSIEAYFKKHNEILNKILGEVKSLNKHIKSNK